jgi:hypothetical protein
LEISSLVTVEEAACESARRAEPLGRAPCLGSPFLVQVTERPPGRSGYPRAWYLDVTDAFGVADLQSCHALPI